MMKKISPMTVLTSLALFGAGCPQTFSPPIACTTEAKQCPDGSYVGRTGPKCEFTPCPTEPKP